MVLNFWCRSLSDGLSVVRLVLLMESAEELNVRPSIQIARLQLGSRHIAGEGTPLLQQIEL